MLVTSVWMALQALEATQNSMEVRNPEVMADIIVQKDICERVSLKNAPRALQMLITLVWMALQALEAIHNNVVVWSPEVMVDINCLKGYL